MVMRTFLAANEWASGEKRVLLITVRYEDAGHQKYKVYIMQKS